MFALICCDLILPHDSIAKLAYYARTLNQVPNDRAHIIQAKVDAFVKVKDDGFSVQHTGHLRFHRDYDRIVENGHLGLRVGSKASFYASRLDLPIVAKR